MPPKLGKGQLPKVLGELKNKLEGEVTVEKLAQLDHGMRNRAFGALRKSIQATYPERMQEYTRIKDELAKREWLASFCMDPESGGTYTATNKTTVSRVRDAELREVWLTEEELGGPKWLNSKTNAAIAIKSMKSRLHSRNSALRANVVLEYQHFYLECQHSYGIKKDTARLSQNASVEQKVDMDAQQYLEVSDAMAESSPGNPDTLSITEGKRRRKDVPMTPKDPKPPPKPPTPEVQERLNALKALKDDCAKTKKFLDLAIKEVEEVVLIEGRLEAKKWAWGGLEWLQKETGKQHEVLGKLQSDWALAAATAENANSTQCELTTSSTVINSCYDQATGSFKDFKKDVLGEFIKLRGDGWFRKKKLKG